MLSELGAETGINKQMVHFVCMLVHRRCKCGLCSTKVLNKVTSISPRPGLYPMRTPPPQMKALCEGYPNMFSELGSDTEINEQMVHFVCVLVHRRCKCGLCSTKMLNKVTSISAHPGLCPMRTHPSNESPLRGLSEYVFGIGG